MSLNITWGEGGGVGKNVTRQFALVITLVKVNKKLCHIIPGAVGGGRRKNTKCHISLKSRKSEEKVSGDI